VPAVRPRGEEQRRARPAHSAGRERDAPHPGHVHGQAAARRPALSVAGVGEDAAAAEVGDEQVAAERAEPVRRKRDASCSACGAKVEIVIANGTYTIVTLAAVVLGSMLLPTILMSIFEKKWAKVALEVVLLFVLIFGTNELLNRQATVQRDARIR